MACLRLASGAMPSRPVEGRLEITLRPAKAGRFGYAFSVDVRLKDCDGAEAALAALKEMGVPLA